MEINKDTISLAKEDESSSNESVANIEAIPEVEKAAVLQDVFTETKPRTAECERDVSNENTNSDSSSDEETKFAHCAMASVRSLENSCRSTVTIVADIVSEGLTKHERVVEIINRVQHVDKANLAVAAKKYVASLHILLNKSYEAEKAAESAGAQARRAEEETARLYTLKAERSSQAEDAKCAVWTAAVLTWKAANDAVKAAQEVWQEINNIRNLEASLKEFTEHMNRIADYSILYTFIVVFLSSCIAAAISACVRFDIYSLYIISMTGCLLLLLGAAVSLVTGVYYRKDEEHLDEEKILNTLEILKKSLHRLNEALKR